MDPYLEDPVVWPEFHRRIVSALAEILVAVLVQRYKHGIEKRRYQTATPQGVEEHEEDYVVIQERSDGRLVTLLDFLSPANKTTATGRQAYLDVRAKDRESRANLVEIDLVLQGEPTLDYSRDGLPHWDYAVTVTRSTQPERYEIYTATLQKRLPRFRLPMAPDDRDTVLDLQAVFTRSYAKGGYSSRIAYHHDPAVPLSEEDRRWLDATLTDQKLRRPRPSDERIARAAYCIWEQEGRPHGHDKEHWDKALAQLRQQEDEQKS